MQLHQWVSVVPIIGKADSMDLKERAQHLYDVRRRLCQANPQEFEIFDFHEGDADGDEEVDESWCDVAAPDFADYNKSDADKLIQPRVKNAFALVVDPDNQCRSYPYGKCEVMNDKHGDFARLMRLVFGEGRRMLLLCDDTHRRYQKWCIERSKESLLERMLSSPSTGPSIFYVILVSGLRVGAGVCQ